MRAKHIFCDDCGCFVRVTSEEGDLSDPKAGVCIRYPPTALIANSWAQYPIVKLGCNGCFEGIAKEQAQVVADKLMEI